MPLSLELVVGHIFKSYIINNARDDPMHMYNEFIRKY